MPCKPPRRKTVDGYLPVARGGTVFTTPVSHQSHDCAAGKRLRLPKRLRPPARLRGPPARGPEHYRVPRYEPRDLKQCEKQSPAWPTKQPINNDNYLDYQMNCLVGTAVFKVSQDVCRRQGPLDELVNVLSQPKRSVIAKNFYPAGCLVLVPETGKVGFKDYDAKHSEDWVKVDVTRGSLLARTKTPNRVIVLEPQFSDTNFAGKRSFLVHRDPDPPPGEDRFGRGGAGRRARHLPFKYARTYTRISRKTQSAQRPLGPCGRRRNKTRSTWPGLT